VWICVAILNTMLILFEIEILMIKPAEYERIFMVCCYHIENKSLLSTMKQYIVNSMRSFILNYISRDIKNSY